MAEEQKKSVEPMLLALARNLAEWFPEVEGRALAVSEIDFFEDKSNLPTLPVVAVALVGEEGQQSNYGGNVTIVDTVLVHFIFEPVKYKRKDGQNTPFYAFYNYERIRDQLLTKLQQWRTPRNGSISYISMDVESDEKAVYIAFRFRAEEKWCPPVPCESEPEAPIKVDIYAKVRSPAGKDPNCPPDCPEPEDPCDFARERNPFGIND